MSNLNKIKERMKIRKKARNRVIFCTLIILGLGGLGVWMTRYFDVDRTLEAVNQKLNPVETEALNADAETTAVTETETETKREPVTITVSAAGDCTMGTDVNFAWDTSFNAYFITRGADYFLQNVKPIFEADDLTIVNFEGTLTDSETRQDKTFAFKGDREFNQILPAGSVEAANLANNHSYDYGEESYNDTLEALQEVGVTTFGYDSTAVMDIKGIKVGLVGIYELHDHLERAQQLKDNIAKVKAEGAELIIVSFHWGNEREQMPDTNQTTLGHMAIDEGADLVIGHHPHVLQGLEKYRGKYIAYSLGNFSFGGNNNPSDKDTVIFQQTFTIDENGVAEDDNINIIPCSISSEYGYNDYCPTPAEGEEATRIMNKFNERSDMIQSTSV